MGSVPWLDGCSQEPRAGVGKVTGGLETTQFLLLSAGQCLPPTRKPFFESHTLGGRVLSPGTLIGALL